MATRAQEPTPEAAAARPATRHSLLDNIQGQAIGIIMVAFGLSLLKAAGLVTGQTAGLALLLSYVGGWSFGLTFFAVNLPFYVFALLRMGLAFTLRTLVAVSTISALLAFAPQIIDYRHLDPLAAAVLAGLCAGLGVLALFRHGSSGGGMGILAVYIQDKFGIRAGLIQILFDAAVFLAAAFVMDWTSVALSLVGAMVLNLVIYVNHRRDWYAAV